MNCKVLKITKNKVNILFKLMIAIFYNGLIGKININT